MAARGRPSIYSEEVVDYICQQIALGRSLVRILDDPERPDLPDYTTVMLWQKQKPDFFDRYMKAKQDQADYYAERILDVADGTLDGSFDPKAARVAIDAYKWTAGKLKPRTYGEKFQIGGAADLPPVQTQTAIDVSGLSLEELEVLQAVLTKAIKKED